MVEEEEVRTLLFCSFGKLSDGPLFLVGAWMSSKIRRGHIQFDRLDVNVFFSSRMFRFGGRAIFVNTFLSRGR